MSKQQTTEENKINHNDAITEKNEIPKFYTRSDDEFGAEVADVSSSSARIQEQPGTQIFTPRKEEEKGRGWGLTAVVLSVVAWFIWPSLLAPAAVLAGLVAFIQGRRGLGLVAIIVGLIAFFSNIGNAIL